MVVSPKPADNGCTVLIARDKSVKRAGRISVVRLCEDHVNNKSALAKQFAADDSLAIADRAGIARRTKRHDRAPR
jgi:hypothetical protein